MYWKVQILRIFIFSYSSSGFYQTKESVFGMAFFFSFLRFCLSIFRERRRVGEREGEKHPCNRETLIGYHWYMPWPGTETAPQAHALTGSQTSDLLLCRMMPIQLSHIYQGCHVILLSQNLIFLGLCLYFHHLDKKKKVLDSRREEQSHFSVSLASPKSVFDFLCFCAWSHNMFTALDLSLT